MQCLLLLLLLLLLLILILLLLLPLLLHLSPSSPTGATFRHGPCFLLALPSLGPDPRKFASNF